MPPYTTEWPEILLDARVQLVVDLHGLPGVFRPSSPWSTPVLELGQHLVYGVAKGRAAVEAEGEIRAMEPGSVAWAAPGTVCRFWQTHSNRPIELLRFRLELGPEAFAPWTFRISERRWDIFPFLHRIVDSATDRSRPGLLRCRAALALLADALDAREPARAPTAGLTAAQRRAVESIDPASSLRPADLARVARLSADYFARQFALTYGCPPRQWLLARRLDRGAGLLWETNLRIGEIAGQLGYDNPFLFTRQFTARFGVSPRRYRGQRERS